MKNGDKKVLIISASPYDSSSQTRVYDSYFSFYKKENIAQIYSRNISPTFEKCHSFFCISDEMILSKRLHRRKDIGKIYNVTSSSANRTDESSFRKIAKNKTGIRYFLRDVLWGNKIWKTKKLISWIENFKPDFIFLSVADDFYLNNMAMWISELFNIPLVLNIVDDYYYNLRKSIDPFYMYYSAKFKKHIKKLFKSASGVIYLSDKIKKEYEHDFSLLSDVIYIPSLISNFPKHKNHIEIANTVYVGAMEPGRYKTIVEFSKACIRSNIDFKIFIYTREERKGIIRKLQKQKNIVLKECVPYDKLVEEISKYDSILLAEGMKKKNILYNRLALSTKTTDSLCFEMPIIFIGPIESGCYSFIKEYSTTIKMVLERKGFKKISNLFFECTQQEIKEIENRSELCRQKYNIKTCNQIFENFIEKIL